ncbi:hypothetical protein P7C73_g735, partial [Tremellales sp. Uapishka_1]
MPLSFTTPLAWQLADHQWKAHVESIAATSKSPLAYAIATTWGKTTDVCQIFDHILRTAKKTNIGQRDMIKRLFIFSDKELDRAADGRYGATEHKTILRKFIDAGYELPELVYWNLAEKKVAKPAPVNAPGVTLYSGFSRALMRYFLGESDWFPLEEDDLISEGDVAYIEVKQNNVGGRSGTNQIPLV